MQIRSDEKEILRAIADGKTIERPIAPLKPFAEWTDSDAIRWVDCTPREALSILSVLGVCRVKPE